MQAKDLAEIMTAARQVWDYIGDDILTAAGKSIPVDEVIEVVIDADRLKDRVNEAVKKNRLSKEAAQEWEQLSYEEQGKLLKSFAFKYKRYGW